MSSSTTDTQTVEVPMPQMGVSVAEGTVVQWRKQVGDAVAADEPIVSIATDKIDTDVEAPVAGQLVEILVQEGETVEVGTALARIGAEGDDRPATEPPQPDPVPERAADSQVRSEPTGSGAAPADAARPRYSPVARRIAAAHDVDLSDVSGSGRNGRVRKRDVIAHIENDAEPAATDRPVVAGEPVAAGEPLSRMRQAIGEHMLQSLRTAATCTTVIEADLTRIETLRRAAGLTSLPYLARATIDTLARYPMLNATLQDGRLTSYDGVHLGVAVSLGADGLIVPVIRDAQHLSVEGLAARIKDVAGRARDRALTPDEAQGGSFTITNPGGYGSIMATPVINQPQVAILDTEAVVKRPIVVTDELGRDTIAIRAMSYLCLSWDHRALDGALAAQFLNALRQRIEGWSE